jgi:hypothetical protein
MNGQPVGPGVHVAAGAHHFEVAGKLKPLVVLPAAESAEQVYAEAGDAFETNVVKDDLLHRCLARTEDHCAHAGGGTDASALINGTTRNGSGGADTVDDGQTFRGYGDGDWLTFTLKQPCDLGEIRTFAGHADARASQRYTVLAAYAADPGKFVKLASGSKTCGEGASELRLPVKAGGVVAVRFEFQNGPLGFNVYREINLIGKASAK